MMRLLVVVPGYPSASHLYKGAFNEKCVLSLVGLRESVEVIVPRPWVPPLFGRLAPRWKTYAELQTLEIRSGVRVHRPRCVQVPRLGAAFWRGRGAFAFCRRTARRLHEQDPFHAILSFDVAGAGGLAWRLGRELGIPAAGWVTGSDVRVRASSADGRGVREALRRLDVVFYQSRELLERAGELVGAVPGELDSDRHLVLPRGIPRPPLLDRPAVRKRIRAEWGIDSDATVVALYLGRIVREKGVFEFLDALSMQGADGRLFGVLVGVKPGFDQSVEVRRYIDRSASLNMRTRLLPACPPDRVWEYLCGADIFVLPTYREGMPNSLLEAMAMGVPSVASSIPPILDIDHTGAGLVTVPPRDAASLLSELVRLADSPSERLRVGQHGKAAISPRFDVNQNMARALQVLGRAAMRDESRKGVPPSTAPRILV
jgi:glycosyltransferase involved in cell wall biosynthesis